MQMITFSTALKLSLEEKTKALTESTRIISVTAQLAKKEKTKFIYVYLICSEIIYLKLTPWTSVAPPRAGDAHSAFQIFFIKRGCLSWDSSLQLFCSVIFSSRFFPFPF